MLLGCEPGMSHVLNEWKDARTDGWMDVAFYFCLSALSHAIRRQ